MDEPQIAIIKSVTFHPVLNGGDPIDIPVSIDLKFENGPTLTYDTSTKCKTYEVDPFPMNIDDHCSVSGKLYAMDRQRGSGYYFALYPTRIPDHISPDIHINVSVMGPCICWRLSVTTLEVEVKEPGCE
jgi:hypothetical protein